MLSIFMGTYIGANNMKTAKEIRVSFRVRLPLGHGSKESTQGLSMIIRI